MSVNLKELAKLLKLSPTTVSRALGGYPDVSSKTRLRVEQAAKQNGYQPNPVARRLQKGKTETIGIVLPPGQNYFKDTFFLDLLAGISAKLSMAGLDLTIAVASDEEHEMLSLRRMVEGKRVDGMILTLTKEEDARVAYLHERGFPFVLYGRTRETRPHAYVDMDGAGAFQRACDYLIEMGHTKIALLNGEPGYMFPVCCREGYVTSLKTNCLPIEPELMREWHHQAARLSSYRQTLLLMELPHPPTAVVFQTEAATGVLQALQKLKLQPGRDVSLIGYDDLEIAKTNLPPLTTLRPPARNAGERVVEILLKIMEGEDAEEFQEIWDVEMIHRESTGPPPIH